VKSHGGFMRLQTELGRGTTFEVYFPATPDTIDVPSTATLSSAPTGNGELILVVDDEEPIRTMLRETLTRHNYRVVTAEDGMQAAVVVAGDDKIKLVLTDLDMPLLDGVNVARILRRLNASIKIVISTGTGSSDRLARFEDVGIAAILPKPYTTHKVLTVVRETLARG
jgi:two-component system, cell cycle sensor histidine kinase and response regulator CckA